MRDRDLDRERAVGARVLRLGRLIRVLLVVLVAGMVIAAVLWVLGS